MKFIEVVRTYEVAAEATATREVVAAPLVGRFAAEVERLGRAVGESSEDETWSAFLRRCRRTLRDLATTPLSPADGAFGLDASADYLSVLLERARGSYAEQMLGRAELCVIAMRDAARDTTNPLGKRTLDVLSTGPAAASGLVVKPQHLDSVRTWLAGAAPEVRLLTEHEMTGLGQVESLVVIGPSFWFPAHLLGAPRAEMTCFVHFDFLRDREPDTRLFVGSATAPGTRIRSMVVDVDAFPEENVVDVAVLIPTIDWDALARATSASPVSPGDADPDAVEANLLLLAGGFSVYLEAVDGPTIDVVVDLEPGLRPRLRNEKTRSVAPGHYIVVRSAGGTGDYIPSIADSRMKRRAPVLRSLQVEWKAALRSQIRERGYWRVERELREMGITSPNLRYRLWHNSIRTRSPNDFRLLMEYIGLGDRSAEIWTAMGEIFEAHLRAGQEVRKLLEQAVLAADVEDLLKTGRVDVSLGEMDAGTLSVLRVEGRSPSTSAVAEDELRVLTRVEDDLWQG